MIGLFSTESGDILSRYSDQPDPIFPVNPVAGPGQVLLDIPSDIIGQAVTGITIASDSEGNPVYTFIINQSSIDQQWDNVKLYRNSLLLACDWTCSVTDYVISNKPDWIAYRQLLRDIKKQVNPFMIVWPQMPSAPTSVPVVEPVVPVVEPVVPVVEPVVPATLNA